MLPLYLNSQLLSLLYDAQASELSSRMNAMKTATDNAKEIQKKLLLAYNKTPGYVKDLLSIGMGSQYSRYTGTCHIHFGSSAQPGKKEL